MNNMANTKQEIDLSNKIVLKSVRGKVGIVIKMQPCKDPKTGNWPSCVKRVDSNGNMVLSEKELNDPNRDFFIREDAVINVVDGMTFDLDNVSDRFKWEAIKNNPFIAPDYYSKDSKGNSLINGDMRPYGVKELYNKETRRYGTAEMYVVRPGVEATRRVSRKKLKHDAETYIYNDERGPEGRILRAKLLGHRMDNMPDADVTDYLLQVAEQDPEKIISLYTGGDTSIRLLFIEARDKHVIMYKNKVYIYADNVVLGATDEAAILYLKDPKHANIVKLIKQDTFPDLDLDGGITPKEDNKDDDGKKDKK